eukprot:1151074-Prorocentrum_minimum.AAC.1
MARVSSTAERSLAVVAQPESNLPFGLAFAPGVRGVPLTEAAGVQHLVIPHEPDDDHVPLHPRLCRHPLQH